MLNLLFQLLGLLPIHKTSVCCYSYLLIGPTKEKGSLCKSLPQSRVRQEIPMDIYNTEANKDIQIPA